jgi:hypothetical protein
MIQMLPRERVTDNYHSAFTSTLMDSATERSPRDVKVIFYCSPANLYCKKSVLQRPVRPTKTARSDIAKGLMLEAIPDLVATVENCAVIDPGEIKRASLSVQDDLQSAKVSLN